MTLFYKLNGLFFIDEYSSRVMLRPYYEVILLNVFSLLFLFSFLKLINFNISNFKRRLSKLFLAICSLCLTLQSIYFVEVMCVGKNSKDYNNAHEKFFVHFGLFVIYKNSTNVSCGKITVKKSGMFIEIEANQSHLLYLYNGGIGNLFSLRSVEESGELLK